MINLYSKDCTNFNNNGIATLTPLECLFKASINEVWSLNLEIPYDPEGKYKFIDNDLILRITDLDAVSEQSSVSSLPYQLFRIYSFRKDTDRMSIVAYPVGLDARFDTYVDNLQLYNMTASAAVSSINAISDKYLITTDMSNTASAEYDNSNIIEILNGSEGFVQKWGGEICYDNYNIKVLSELGANNGVGIRYGKNIESMYFDLDSSNVITRLYPKSAGGEALNGIELYELSENHYVDASNINDYPIPHIYFVQTPFALTKLNNDGSEEYVQSSSLYDNIANYVRGRVASITDTLMQSNQNLSLEYIKEQALLTLQNDGVVGFAERVANIFCTNSHFVSEEFIEFVKKAVIEGFDLYFSNTDVSRVWIASGSKYSTGGNSDWLVKNAWALNGSKWCYLDANGYFDVESPTSDVVDTATWKWYKVKVDNTTIRRFGNKKRDSVYCWLHNGMETVNGKWYYFDSSGISYTDQTLFNMIANIYDGIGDDLANNYGTSEEDFYQRLYSQMVDYCQEMYNEGINYPTVNIDIDMVDISKTSEYADFQDLIKVHLGDTVLCYNSKLGITTSERVVGIEYDALRKFNSRVILGTASNSVISMLNNIGSDNGPKFIAGEGIEIQNNVISVIPPKVPVKDVKVGGVSVVSGGVAYIDVEESEGALEYFIETENALYGDNGVTYLVNDKDAQWKKNLKLTAYKGSGEALVTTIVSGTVNSGESDDDENPKVIGFFLDQEDENYYIQTIQQGQVAHGMAVFFSTSQSELYSISLSATVITTAQTISSNFVSPFSVNFNATETPTSCILYYTDSYGSTREMFYNNPVKYATTIAEVDGETWYGLAVYKYGADFTEYEDLLNVRDSYSLPNVAQFQTFEDFAEYIIPIYKNGSGLYSGISRTNELAFFAGGVDDTGLGAPIKIWTDGTYEGLGKVEDVLVNNISVLNNENIASIDLSDYQNKSVHILQADYNELSDAQKKDGRIYFVYRYNYEFHESSDGKLVVRIGADGTKWFFRGYTKESGDVTPPSSLSSYVPSSLKLTSNYPNGGTSQNGWIGFYRNKIRSWNQSKAQTMAGTFYGVLNVDGAESQITPYYDPYDDVTPIMISYMGVEYYVGMADVQVNGTSVMSGGVANVTTEEILNPSSAIDYFSVTSNLETSELNLTEISTIETSGVYFDYKIHAWSQGASALLQEYEAEIQSSQGLITSSYKHSSYTDVAEGYELTHYTKEKTLINPYGVDCSHETIGDENPDTGLTRRGLCQCSALGSGGLRVYEYDYENDEEVCALRVLKNDVVLNEATWDGTNDSLKDALAGTLTALSSKQDILTAGSNITIENNVISATGGGGSGADVEANPSTEATEDLLKLRINNKTYRVNDGDNSVILFDGEWKNQDVLEITPYNATLTDGELVCSGLNAGVVVSDVSGLPSGTIQYQVIIEGYSEEGFQYQAGRCNPTTNLSGIIQSGTNRLSYNNDNVVADKDYKFTFNVSNVSQGIFLGGYYNVSTTYYKITRIKLITTSTVERTYD